MKKTIKTKPRKLQVQKKEHGYEEGLELAINDCCFNESLFPKKMPMDY